jgi:metallo-beta-lactamase class B
VTLRKLKAWKRISLLAVLSVGMASAQSTVSRCSQCAEWNRPQAPFRIFGNVYYVGPHGLSSVLITSEAGHVLIDGDLQNRSPPEFDRSDFALKM